MKLTVRKTLQATTRFLQADCFREYSHVLLTAAMRAQEHRSITPSDNLWIKFRIITCGGTRIRCQTLMIQRLSMRRSKRPKIEGSGENSRNARKRLFVFAAGPKVSASKAIFPVAV